GLRPLFLLSLSAVWPPRLIIIGPSAMAAGLAGGGVLMAPGPVAALILPIVLIGIGIGSAWAFVLQRVMSGAKEGEENTAAASAATVQQAGFALGAAVAGLVANASGLDNGLDLGSVAHASLWVPLALVAAPLAAGAIGARLNLMVPRSPKQGLTPLETAKWRAGNSPSNSDRSWRVASTRTIGIGALQPIGSGRGLGQSCPT